MNTATTTTSLTLTQTLARTQPAAALAAATAAAAVAPEITSCKLCAHFARMLLVAGAAACVAFSISPAQGLLAGAAIALLLGNPAAKLTHKLSGWILQVAVVLLGAGMNLGVVWRVGAGGVGYTVAGIALAMSAGLWLGRRLGLERDVALLVSAGTAICGGSAIAAVSAATKPKASDVALSLVSIFLLTALGMLVFPALGRWMGFSQEQFGMWSALALHDTSSVVGAATGYGATALGIAVTVKLTRALWIVPLTAAMSWWHERKAAQAFPPVPGNRDNHGANSGADGNVRATLPQAPAARKPIWKALMPQPFIIAYLVLAAVFTYAPVVAPALGGVLKEDAAPWCNLGAHRFLALALFLIGAGLSRKALKKTGARPLVAAGALWIFVSAVTALALWAGWIVAPRM